MLLQFIVLLTATALLTGCATSGVRYTETHENNLLINLKIDDQGGLFTSVEVVAGINIFDKNCASAYKGYIELSPGVNNIGLAPGILTYLIVEVSHSRHGKSGSFSRGTLIKPIPGKKYGVDISYIDNMYDFRLYEMIGSNRRPLELVPHTACEPGDG